MKPVWQKIHHMGQTHALVENRKGETYMVSISKPHCKHAEKGDEALVVKSSVSGHWLMIDYTPTEEDMETGFHPSFQTQLEAGDIYE